MGRKNKRKSERPKHGTRPPDMEVLTTEKLQWKIDLFDYVKLLQFYLTKTQSVTSEIGSAVKNLSRALQAMDKAGTDKLLDKLTELEVKKNKLEEANKKVKVICNGDYFQGMLIEDAATKKLIEEQLRLLECAEHNGTKILVMKTTLLQYHILKNDEFLNGIKYIDSRAEYGRITQKECVEKWSEEKTTDLPSFIVRNGTLLHIMDPLPSQSEDVQCDECCEHFQFTPVEETTELTPWNVSYVKVLLTPEPELPEATELEWDYSFMDWDWVVNQEPFALKEDSYCDDISELLEPPFGFLRPGRMRQPKLDEVLLDSMVEENCYEDGNTPKSFWKPRITNANSMNLVLVNWKTRKKWQDMTYNSPEKVLPDYMSPEIYFYMSPEELLLHLANLVTELMACNVGQGALSGKFPTSVQRIPFDRGKCKSQIVMKNLDYWHRTYLKLSIIGCAFYLESIHLIN